MSDRIELLLVGAGYMGAEYGKALSKLDVPYIALTRSKTSAEAFAEKTGHSAVSSDLKSFIATHQSPTAAIVAVPVSNLFEVSLDLLEWGVERLLIEKPGALNQEELLLLEKKSLEMGASCYIAYNRRFYPSVQQAKKMIQADGGPVSFCFEFTEWSTVIEGSSHPAEVKENWLLANSSHVIDLAFFLGGGLPVEMNCLSKGGTSWHPRGSVYAGSGCTESGALFCYMANWESAGRWGVEVCTQQRRYVLRPLEELAVIERNTIAQEIIIPNDSHPDIKIGIVEEVAAFLGGEGEVQLPSLSEHLKYVAVYQQIAGM